ncbi:MAG: FAD-dependent monooxygenase, partial [Dermabacteraceae bacterium]
MTSPTHPSTETVLISGASIAGPTLAYWLHRYGFEVTIVEKARTPRGGGYPIDVRGTAIEVVRRMGVLPRLQAANLHIERFTFVDADGVTVASLPPHEVTGSVVSQDLEMGRGDLNAALYAAVRDDVEFLFDDSIDTFEERDDGVDVEFRSGSRRRFDLVIGADGMHSRTRRLQFGAEEQFHRYLGYAFGVFTMPNTLGLF